MVEVFFSSILWVQVTRLTTNIYCVFSLNVWGILLDVFLFLCEYVCVCVAFVFFVCVSVSFQCNNFFVIFYCFLYLVLLFFFGCNVRVRLKVVSFCNIFFLLVYLDKHFSNRGLNRLVGIWTREVYLQSRTHPSKRLLNDNCQT